MTITDYAGKVYEFRACHEGRSPTKWFISSRLWRSFCDGAEAVYMIRHDGITGNSLVGIPVFLVGEDEIFECC